MIILGAGNIGLVTALCFAEKGHDVYCVDNNQSKVNNLKIGVSSIYEPGLEPLLKKHLSEKRIHFSSELSEFIEHSDVVVVAVGTPNSASGEIDLQYVESAVSQVAALSTKSKTVILRSTVPPGTNQSLSLKFPKIDFISSPEFLREGSAVHDGLHPERLIVGSNKADHLKLFQEMYKNFEIAPSQIIQMDPASAELSKYAANVFLATRISLINEFSRICEKTGANIQQIKKAIGMDSRIGSEFLNAGIGYGGSCFPKDIDALINFAASLNEKLNIVQATKETNESQVCIFAEKIKVRFKDSASKNLALWGASFKPETDDLREAPSLKLISLLCSAGFNLNIYDPKATTALSEHFKNNSQIKISTTAQLAVNKADALVIVTEWPEFGSFDMTQLKSSLKNSIVFDGRNQLNPQKMKQLGFEYYSVGRPS